MTPVQTNGKSGSRFREQAVLTVKVLLLSGGTLGFLALLEWIAVK
jgi:hypothetical protein